MNNLELLEQYIFAAENHAIKLQQALDKSNGFSIKPESLKNLSVEQSAFLDMVANRFSKLQDVVGRKIFTLLINLLEEDDIAFIDVLNKLEKLDFLPSSDWWLELRDIRNLLTHEYPDDFETISKNLRILLVKSSELLEYWHSLKTKIKKRFL